jgi:LysR family transcriptional regulator, hydrogen peroxide-inducible genes activator
VELTQIRYFVMLCSERSFTKAARRCGVSQPSLSNGIKALESELGGQLFERTSMTLTALGKSVRPQFEIAGASVGQITRGARAFHQRQAFRRRAAAARILRLEPGALLNRAQSFEEPPQSEAAND